MTKKLKQSDFERFDDDLLGYDCHDCGSSFESSSEEELCYFCESNNIHDTTYLTGETCVVCNGELYEYQENIQFDGTLYIHDYCAEDLEE